MPRHFNPLDAAGIQLDNRRGTGRFQAAAEATVTQRITPMRRHLLPLVAVLMLFLAVITSPAMADDAESFLCPMRGKPCAEVDFAAAGRCPDCGMRLVPAAEYAALTANMKTVGVVLYTAFEALDVYGPVEMWGSVQDLRIVTIAEKAGPITSAQGTQTVARHTFEDCPKLDILLVPGGMGTLKELTNEKMLAFLREQSAKTELVTSVCSGSMLLAKAGVLDGHKATSNKKYFDMAISQSDKVDWIQKARWVEDGKFVTSSGVSAGIDMALHVIRRLYGEAEARKIAGWSEYTWNDDPDNDPFAKPEANKN
jgi:putative intracellular protease/amidase